MPGRKFSIIISAINEATGPLKKVQRQIRGIGKSIQQTGRSMSLALTAPIAAFGGLTIRAAADFEAAMNRVRGITKANAEEFKNLREQAKELGSTTQFSASEAASAQEELARAGFDVQQVMGALPSVLELAASSNVSLSEAAGIAGGALKGFRREVGDLAKVNDALVTTNLSTKTDLISLSDAMKEVAPIAASMGLEFNEVAAAAGLLGDNLLESGRGGVGLKVILSRLANPSTEAQRALARLKIPRKAVLDSQGNVTSLIAVIEQLESSGASATDIFQIFGDRGALAINALVGAGSEKLKLLKTELDGPDSVGEAGRQAAIRMEGASGAMKELRSAVEGLQIAIGESGLLETFTDIVKSLTGMAQSLSGLSPTTLKYGTIIAGLVAVIGPLLIALGLMVQGWALLLPVFAAVKVIGIAVAAAFGAITLPVWGIVAAVAALAAGAVLLIKFWDPIKAFFLDLWESISAPLQGIVGAAGSVASFLGLGAATTQPAGASAGGSVPIPPAAQAEVTGQIGLKVDVENGTTRVTQLESARGGVGFDVDTGPVFPGT